MKKELSTSFLTGKLWLFLITTLLVVCTHFTSFSQCVTGGFTPQFTGMSLTPGTFADPSLIPDPTAASDDGAGGSGCAVTVMPTGVMFTNPASPAPCQSYQINIEYQAMESDGSTDMTMDFLVATVDPTLCIPVFSGTGNFNVQCLANAPPAPTAADCAGNVLTPTETSNTNNGGSGNNGNPLIITRTYEATSACGGTVTASQVITIEDTTPPNPICMNITVQLDGTGNATIANNAVNNGSTDNCSIGSISVFPSAFTCADIGANNVTMVVQDNANNSANCTAVVTVEENENPVAVCQNITIQLDVNGNQTITPADIDNGSFDNCGTVNFSINTTAFTCGTIGGNTVVLTATDGSGNSATCNATVTTEDNIAPQAICQNITVQLDATGNITVPGTSVDNGSNDACGIDTYTLSTSSFTCANIGVNSVMLTVADMNGNNSTCNAMITVQDGMNPMAVCQNISVPLNASGNATITANDVDGGSSDNCNNNTLSVSPNTFTCANLGVNTVTLTISDNHGNSDQCSADVTVVDNLAPTALCMNATAQLNAVGNASITAAQINNNSTDNCALGAISVNPTTFTCANLGANTVALTVNDANGNTATCTATVTVQDNINPTAVCQNTTVQLNAAGNASITTTDVNNGSADNCSIATMSVDPNAFSCSDIGNVNATLTVTDGSGNAMTCVSIVTVEDNVNPTAICQDLSVNLNATGNATVLATSVNNGSSDNCTNLSFSLSQTAFNCTNVGVNPVTLTVSDDEGNTATCTANITIADNTNPTALCQNAIVNLDAGGNGSIVDADLNGGSTDNCGIASILAAQTAFTCADAGDNTVILTVTDVNGNSATCNATVTVQENIAPMAICMPATLQLNAAGMVTVTTANVNNGSTDNCGTVNLSVAPSALNCSNVGTNTVTLTATDNSGNTATCTAIVTVQDNVNPTPICNNFTLQLNTSGNATLLNANVDASTDACGIANVVLSQTAFTCADLGANIVSVMVTDNNGNMASCNATVTVADSVDPTAICQNATVQLDAVGNGSITTTDIDNGSNDNCGTVSLGVSPMTFTCAEVGANTVTLTVDDTHGNIVTCTATVTVEDNVDPNEICQDITVQLDATGNATIDPNLVDNGSNDACGIALISVAPNTVSCANIGTINVTLSVFDNNGNMETCTATVTVEDNIAPTAICQNISILLDNTGNQTIVAADINNGSNDNCTAVTLAASQTAFTCADLGANTVTLTVTDSNTNSATCNATVTVTENTPMVVNCPADINMMTTASCTATVTYVEPTVIGCGYILQSQTHASGDMFPQGTTMVEYVFGDGVNTLMCNFNVTVTDMGAASQPMLNCGSLTAGVAKNTNMGVCMANGFNLTPVMQTDDCGAGNLTLTYTLSGQTTGTGTGIIPTTQFFNLGISNVVYVLTDNSGNTDQCSFTITVNDAEMPMLDCTAYQPSVSASVDANLCTASGLTLTVNPTDNCGIGSLTYSLSGATTANSSNTGVNNASGETFNAGTTLVTYTVTDNSGNADQCSFNVVISDNVNPMITCPTTAVLTVNTDPGTCGFTQQGTTFDPTFSDNCPIVSIENDRSDTNTLMGENFPIGITTVIWVATDNAGNQAMCTINVMVEDNEDPMAICQPFTAQLNASGNVTITSANINNGSTDNCGVMSVVASPTAFTCANVGVNNVILTVTDNSGNTDNCTAVVTIEDNVNPTATCVATIPLTLNAAGTVSILSSDLDDNSTDACGIQSFVASQTTFTCDDIGINMVTLTVTDNNGNTATCITPINVSDSTVPNAICQNATVQLSAGGNVTITGNTVDNGSNDACGIATTSVAPNTFTCANVGNNNVTLTVTDNNGNVATCTAVVTVQDTEDPTAICQNITIQLDANGDASILANQVNNGSNDNCGAVTLFVMPNTFDCSNLGANTVTLTVTDTDGNTDTCDAIVTVEDPVSPVAICQNATLVLNAAGNVSLNPNQINNSSTDACGITTFAVSPNVFTCANVGANTVTLTIEDASGNDSNCTAMVTVQDNTNPTAVCQDATIQLNGAGNAILTAAQINNGSNDACGISSTTLDFSNFNCTNIGANTVTLTVMDNNGNMATCTATVTIEDNVAPNAICQNISIGIGVSGSATIAAAQINNGSTDNCGIASIAIAPTTFTCANIGANTVTLTVTDNAGNADQCTATVTVTDSNAPTAICQNVTIQLDNTGNVSLNANQIDNGSSAPCGTMTLSVLPNTFNCSNVGANTVTLTVTANNAMTDMCTATVTVEDNVAPTATCQPFTVQLNAAGNATITAGNVDNGSNDACGIATLAVSPSMFTCNEVGANTVTLTVTDNNSNTSTCNATVTVEDNVNPNAICQNTTIQLDAAGNASIVATALNNGSNNACGIASVVAAQTAFTCANVGNNSVILTITDNNGNVATCNANVVVQDLINPVAICQNATIQLDATGNATITENTINNGSNDACGILNLSAFPNAFTCANIGNNTVTLFVEDNNGNMANCTATVIVEDNENPTAICQSITIQLDAAGDASIVAADVDNGSNDNCGTVMLSVSPNVFDCSNMGANNVTLSVTDTDNNTTTCTAIVTVEDLVSPVAICQNATIQLDATGNMILDPNLIDNGSTDACGIINFSVNPSAFNCTNIGTSMVTLTVMDANGNSSICTANVTVDDNTNPTATCQNIMVDLDATGNASVTAMQVDNGSADACGVMSVTLDIFNFNCTNIGDNAVVLTVMDFNGNMATCNATVTVNDNENPTAVCQNVSVGIGPSGNITVLAAQVDNGSSDNCGNVTLAVAPNIFTCTEVGANNVILTVTDDSGNEATCAAVVTVTDSSMPTAICMNATIQLDATGNATLNPALVDGGSSAPCGTMTLMVAPNTFTCANLGANTVTLTVSDNNGMTDNCTATVTVEDNVAPNAICQDMAIQLDATGNASITTAQINNGSTDACGITQLTLSQTTFACANVGTNTVTLSVEDGSGNVGTCTATVTVNDNMNPTAICQDITTQLDGNGMAMITGAVIDNGSTDACGILSVVASPATFDCGDLGNNNVILTVTDNNGNTSTCTAVVTIEDIMNPTAICQNIAVQLNAAGNATIVASQIDNGSNDNCGIATLAASQTVFTCVNAGANNVTLTVTSNNGETATCVAIVTVQDNINPTATCQDIQITLDAGGNYVLAATEIDNGSTDNCSVNLSVNISNFTCANVGNNTVTLTATDAAGHTASCTSTVGVIASAACSTPVIANFGGPTIADPCNCIGNGQFSEEVVITAMGSGQMWSIQTTTLINPNTGVAFTAGTMFIEQPAMAGTVQYTLVGNHLDGQGYALSATSPFYPGVVLEVSNTCFYPDPVIVTDLTGVICAGTAPIILVGNAGAGVAGTGAFSVNGTTITEINPATLGTGNYLLTFTFNAGVAGSNDPTNPGCVESVTTTFEILETPDFQGCNDNETIVLGPTCEALITPDVILEGDFGCEDDYTVELTNQFGQVVANPITSAYIGQTLTGTVTHTPSGNFCSSQLLIVDSIVPTIDCQPITITCMDALPPFGTGVTGMDNCDANPSEILLDQVFNTDDNCTDAVANDGIAGFVTVTRTYIAEDAGGLQSTPCQQIITITRPDDVDFPDDVFWSCEQYAANPNIIDAAALHPGIIAGFGTEFPVGTNGFGFDLTGMATNDSRLTSNVPNSNPARPTGAGVPSVGTGNFCNYSVTYSQNVIGICGYGNSTAAPTFKIIRTWSVLDWCTSQIITTNDAGEDNVQVIVVMDSEGPTLIGANVTLSTNISANGNTACSTNGLIPMPTVTDNCTGVTSVQAFIYSNAALTNTVAAVNSNGVISPAIGVGNYFIGYTATDACGNVGQSIAYTLTVLDTQSPTMICDEITEINVPSTGVATVPAGVFDDGSYDNCCMTSFSARRMDDNCGVAGNTAFGPTVTFCCADAGATPVTVILRATDCHGNSNTCTVTVNVGDKIAPTIACPANATIDCDQYEATLRIPLQICNLNDNCESNALTNAGYGNVTVNDNCSAIAQPTVNINLDNCGKGMITRSFSAIDAAGNPSNTCTQTITINHASDWVVEFGEDVTLDCGATAANVTDAFGEPEIFFETCEMIATSFEDETYTVVPDACFKIIRTWKVINWCVVGNSIDQEANAIELSETALGEDLNGDGILNTRTFRDSYKGTLPTTDNDPDADTQDGFITYIQVVKVIDDEAPTFVAGCPIADVCISDNTCGATVNFAMPLVDDCVTANLVTLAATSDLGTGFGPFNNVAPGTYNVTFQATDNCGNTTPCISTVKVKDCVLPSPVCVEGLVVELMATNDPNNPGFEPMATITTSLINAGSYDNCPFAAGGLKISFSANISDVLRTFTCDSVGDRTVRLYATDAAGLQDFCETEVTVQANQGQCGSIDPLEAMIAGNVATETTTDVENVLVYINGTNNVAMNYMTDEAGMFDMNVPLGGDYTVVPVKDDNHGNGVTTFDLVKISKHILDIQPLDSPYKMIAADANNSKSITTLDLVHIRKLILLIDTEFTNNTSWRFVDADYVFPNPANPWLEVFPEVISINNLTGSQLAEDFVAIKIGDVNATAIANQLLGADDRTQTDALILTTNNVAMKAGESYAIAMTAADFHHFGYQFTMKLATDKLALDRIENGLATADNFGKTLLEEGILTTSWNQAAATKWAADAPLFTLHVTALTDGSLVEALHLAANYTPAEAYAANGDLQEVELHFQNATATDAFALYQNRPNPFADATTIGFYLPTAQSARLTISDLSGKMVYSLEQDFGQGNHEIRLNRSDIGATGVLYYRLETAEGAAVRKMIVE